MENKGRGVRVPSGPQIKALHSKAFSFLGAYSAKTVSKKYTSYRSAKIIKTAARWYIEYYYRIPDDLKPLYNNKDWHRFRVFEDINRHKTDEYANLLCEAVNHLLTEGYNPFEEQSKLNLKYQDGVITLKVLTIKEALEYFIDKWAKRGLEKSTMNDYKFSVEILIAWFKKYDLLNMPANTITSDNIEKCLYDYKDKNTWSNRRFNNILSAMRTIFNYLVKKSILTKNPCIDIDMLLSPSKKHKFYDEKKFSKVIELAKKHDPYLYFAIQCVYYLCIRSEKELKNFMVKNIFPETKQVLITAGGSKTKTDRYIPLHDDMLQVFKERKILDYSDEYFVFSTPSRNGSILDGKPGKEQFGHGFFSGRFVKIRKLAGLSNDYTLYGFKHTRAIHLKIDGASDAEIMALTGHSDYTSFAKYLRDIGIGTDLSKLDILTRKI